MAPRAVADAVAVVFFPLSSGTERKKVDIIL
jgi:hypothetical protein